MSPDAELLRRYLHDRDEGAFAAIVRRHGPMVLAACRRVTANRADADDAFQATFLVLAAKAGAIGRQAQLGGWLHGVAVRCGKKARDAARRSATRPQPLDALPAAPVTPPDPDLSAVVDDALASLPDAYRAAVVLCHLEGRSRAEAARELGWTEGTLSGRLHRALRRLGERLSARGVSAAGAAALAVLSARPAEGCVPLPLVAATCSAAGLVSAGFAEPGPAHSLATGVLRAMTIRKLKLAAVGIGLFALGAFAVTDRVMVVPATAAPVPKAKAVETYFPTAVGTKWVYERENGDSLTEEITEVTEKEGKQWVSIRTSQGGNHSDDTFTVSAQEVVARTTGPFTLDTRRLKLPLKEGDTWAFEIPSQRGLKCDAGKITVGTAEAITVPAGTFEAVRVVSETTAVNGKAIPTPERCTRWYAAGVGEVKIEYPGGHRVLKEFTPAKK